jgi:hypothetical protein
MKTGGYYFCNHCEENAFGELCQTCHRPSQFHPDPMPIPALPTEKEKPAEPVLARVADERGHALFAEMRQKLFL